MNYDNLPLKDIFCIDMKCFYASCIAMLEGLDFFKDPIAVIGNFEQAGRIVLAASPVMKEKLKTKIGNRRYIHGFSSMKILYSRSLC
ncbi:hypothetical protein [Lysinibacillus xylanilyticus]|uniref:hypothetical protein n=1 Tax=Lysinibacillus xylanilyticus TaxID=582475 RepID=UPI0018E2566A|nr:hypothetical protein [Lysinibacillus xylanilyticus]